MTASILVATPHAPFGELLRISLEESGLYQVRLVQSAKEALAAFRHASYQMAILDSALSDEPFVPFCKELINLQKGIRVVIIPPENNPNHPTLGGLIPHGYLSRPFYLPDLMATVAGLLGEHRADLRPPGRQAPAAQSFTEPTWLVDPLAAGAYLEHEISGTPALAGIIGTSGPQPHGGAQIYPGSHSYRGPQSSRGILRASAGSLSGESAEELTGIVFRYWKPGEKTDLMRYIRLSADKRDYLVYATEITGDLVLILVYHTTAPLSMIRPRTKEVAHTLASLPPESYYSRAAGTGEVPAERRDARSPASREPQTQPNQEERRTMHERGWFHEGESSTAEASPPKAPLLDEEAPGVEEESGPDASLIDLAALLGAVPPPDPDAVARGRNGWHPETLTGGEPEDAVAQPSQEHPQLAAETSQPAAEQSQPAAEPSHPAAEQPQPEEASQAEQLAPEADTSGGATGSGATGEQAASVEPEAQPLDEAEFLFPAAHIVGEPLHVQVEPPIDALEDTRPRVISTINRLSQLEPVSPALSLLHYTCVLLPRMPRHFLAGELADRLSQWVVQLCVAFGWRLEGISVRPEYLQWSVQVAPAVSPGNIVRILRQRTSLHIFNAFPKLAEENPSGDFWATGYLIVSGPQPPSSQLLRDYLQQTRKRQGVSKETEVRPGD